MVGKTHRWEDGCIVDRSAGTANLIVYEVSAANSWMEELGRIMGMPLDRLVFNAATSAAEGVVRDSIQSHPALFRLASTPPLHRIVYAMSAQLMEGIGAGRIELLAQKGGQGRRETRLRVSHPFNPRLVSSLVAGFVRAFYGLPVTCHTREEGGAFIVEIRQDPAGAGEGVYHRLAPARLVPARGHAPVALPACGRCGAPRGIGDLFVWDPQRGMIAERAGGQRVIFASLYLFDSMIREVHAELGEPALEVFQEVERRLFARKLASAPAGGDPWEEEGLRGDLALRGLGLLRKLEADGEGARIVVDNVFVAPIVAGRLLALWEYRYGREAECEYSITGNTLDLSIHPAA